MEMVDRKNISRLEKSLDWERSRNRILRDEMSAVCMKKNQEYFELYTQLRNLQASHLVGEKAGEKGQSYVQRQCITFFLFRQRWEYLKH